MACVILPSETARLVYGYLVKENLNNIALQFLETSPYLIDCCQIVKSGHQFNTKLIGKDLQDLLQEYSVIHNLVNSKVSLLQKSSLLYKRIKLKCESISEILELILFWKYKNQKTDQNFVQNDKSEKESNNQANISDCDFKIRNDIANNKTCCIDNREHIRFSNTNNVNDFQTNENYTNVNFNSKLNLEISSINKGIEENDNFALPERPEGNDIKDISSKERHLEFTNVEMSEISGNNENNAFNNNNNNNNNRNNNNKSNKCDEGNGYSNNSNISNNVGDNNTDPSSEYDKSTNIYTADINSRNNIIQNEIKEHILDTNTATTELENEIKIVRIEKEMQNENQNIGVYSENMEEGNMNLDNNSVVFVSPEVGNVTINQERSQIIVIPIDYYKSQNSFHNTLEINTNDKDILLPQKEIIEQGKNEVIFAGVEDSENCVTSIPQLYNDNINSNSTVEENIMTETDFLKNSQLMYNFEKELKTSDVRTQAQSLLASSVQSLQEISEKVSINPEPTPLIVVSQAILQKKPQRYRTILPKKSKPVQPVRHRILIHPLIESNKEVYNPQVALTRSKETKELKAKREVNKKSGKRVVKKRLPCLKKIEITSVENSENLSMPTIKTPLTDKKEVEEKIFTEPDTDSLRLSTEECTKDINIEKTNEEKENLEKVENKKTETPVFVTRRNSKRQSLSTPRRRSHIRALEFETPPKTNEEKKSKTSPKIKVEQINNIERKSVRNTLFKSPDPENNFKSSSALKGIKKINTPTNIKTQDVTEPLNELSIPIATRSPNTKLSDAWETLTGVGCVIGQNEPLKACSVNNKMWDADLRDFILENNQEVNSLEKKRIRKPEKHKKDNRKTGKKKILEKKSKPVPHMVSPSKMNLTAKRNTYSINGNEEGSPLSSNLEDLKIVTPFKGIDIIRPAEETPLTKLLRENINTIDIDLSMINTPSFPPTPSIVITPDIDDTPVMSGTNYYSPTKDCSKNKVLKITDYFRVDAERSMKNESKEMQEKVINELVCKAKEIIGLSGESQEEGTLKRRPSGKILSMVKIQMLSQCDKKLCENIPINEENSFSTNISKQNLNEDKGNCDLKIELEEKRKRALKKIKVVKENLSCTKKKVTGRSRKRKRSECLTKFEKSKSDESMEVIEGKRNNGSDENIKESLMYHSTPYAKKKSSDDGVETDTEKRIDNKILDDIRQEFPPFQENEEKYTQLSEKSRKKLHYVESFLKLDEVAKFLNVFNEKNPPKLLLKPSLRRFFQVFYRWLRHPHKHEVNASLEIRSILQEYLLNFDKINKGLSRKRSKGENNSQDFISRRTNSNGSPRLSGNKPQFSDDEEWKKLGNERRKEDIEDGVVTTLPLKKRKSTVQQVEVKDSVGMDKSESKSSCVESVSQAQTFLQDIDVDRFLSQIHGQVNR